MHSMCSFFLHIGQVQQVSSWFSYWHIMQTSAGSCPSGPTCSKGGGECGGGECGGGGGCVCVTSTLTIGRGSGGSSGNDALRTNVLSNFPPAAHFGGASSIVSVASFTFRSVSSLKRRSCDAARAAAFRPQRMSFGRFEPEDTHCRSSSESVTITSKDANGNRSTA